MADPVRVSVVIPVYNQVDLLDRCLASLQQQEGVALEVIVVSDASPQDPGPVVQRYPEVRLLRAERNMGYAAANNLGLAVASGEALLFLNSDTEVPPDAIRRMTELLETHLEAGGVTPLHREPNGTAQRTCFRFPSLKLGFLWDSVVHRLNPRHPLFGSYTMEDWDFQSARWVDHAQTSCLLIRRAVYDRIGGMDPSLFLFYNDTDFCHRMSRQGSPIWFTPEVEILHHGGASVGTFEQADAQVYGDRFRYYRKWFGWRGGLAVRTALWSRVCYEMLVELTHGDFRFAARKMRRGILMNRGFRGSP